MQRSKGQLYLGQWDYLRVKQVSKETFTTWSWGEIFRKRRRPKNGETAASGTGSRGEENLTPRFVAEFYNSQTRELVARVEPESIDRLLVRDMGMHTTDAGDLISEARRLFYCGSEAWAWYPRTPTGELLQMVRE